MGSKISTVAAVRVGDYAAESVAAGLEQALALLGGLERFVQPGDRVLLKPNLLKECRWSAPSRPIRKCCGR